MGRKFLDGGEDPWEYSGRVTVQYWAQQHVLLAVAAGALIWFGIVYVMTLVIDLFM